MASLPFLLFELEEIDSRIEADQATVGSLAERLRADPGLAAAEKRVDELEKAVRAAEARQRQLEGVVDDATRTMERLNKILYGGSIHDSREMDSMQKEIEHAGHKRGATEDELLEAMDAAERLGAELAAARARAELLAHTRTDSIPAMRSDLARLQAEIQSLRGTRAEKAAAMDPAEVERYERLRARHRHAVSHVQNEICQWCRVQIPRADLQHARSGSLVMCTNCSRILYVDAAT